MEEAEFYELVHEKDTVQTYGCLDPRCRFVYTEDEIKSNEFKEFQENHLYSGNKVRPYKLESKIWKPEEITNAPSFEGWTPAFTLVDNGFEFIAKIDLFEVFNDIKKPRWNHNLGEKKEEIARILDGIGYQGRQLVIFRTLRYGLAVWDSIYLYAVGNYHSNKKKIRNDLTSYYLNEQRREHEEVKHRIAQNKTS